jgi:hypothetical protein
MRPVSQQADSTTRSALLGAAVVAASAGAGALVGYVNNGPDGYRGLATLGGAFTGSTAAGVAGLIVAAASKKHRKTALATAALGLGGVTALLLGTMVSKAFVPGPAATPLPAPAPGPGSNIPWAQVPITTLLQPQVVYRLSDAATSAELALPPTVAATQASLGPAFQVDGVWTGLPPAGWVPADVGTGRVFVEFFVTSPTSLPAGLTSAARLFTQQAQA